MKIIDAHCDTLYEVAFNNKELLKNNLHIDLKRMKKYDSYTQFFAIWLENSENASEKFLKMADKFDEEINKNADIVGKCFSYDDMRECHKNNKIGAFLALEGAYNIQTDEDIDFIYKKGVRFVTLTWNYKNKIAGGVESEEGLSRFGEGFIKRAEELGIIIDVSHLNERSFYDVIKVSKKPIIASHSNSKALKNHVRNLTDEQFIKICKTDGVVGINFYSDFLSDETAKIDDIIAHIKHFIKLGGENHIGLGSDFDGVSRLPLGVLGVESMENIILELSKVGISDNVIDKITYKNFERIISLL